MPWRLQSSIICWSEGLLAIGSIGLGIVRVSGISREPSPADKIIAFIIAKSLLRFRWVNDDYFIISLAKLKYHLI